MSRPLVLVLALLVTATAHAGSPRYHAHTETISTAACPTGSPGLAADGIAWGISLSGLRGFQVIICPVTTGAYFTGTGTMHVCLYSPTTWGTGTWAISTLEWDLTDKTTTADNPCLALDQLQPVVSLSDRVFAYPSTDLGVSAGTAVTVYLYGETF